MREEFLVEKPDLNCLGITPAHAGRMKKHRSLQTGHRDHPRACGKNARLKQAILGKTRITPAHAGRILKNSINIAILYQLLP